jgi:thiol-disulfide isomerase/thioredoxin
LTSEGEFPPLNGATGWLNSQPLTARSLRGRVVLVNFWTFSCINSIRVLPYLRAWAAKYKNQGLIVIGVQTPEFEFEKRVENVRWAVKDKRIDYPIAIDNDQFYFATERGRAGYDQYRRDFAKLIWQIASPKWNFDDATFNRTAASFDNPDHVAIVIHNYRFRIGLAEDESQYDKFEKQLALLPTIAVPTITLEGDANGAPHPADAAAYRQKFSGKYASRIITGGIGHNLAQEAPQAFAQAVMDVDAY